MAHGVYRLIVSMLRRVFDVFDPYYHLLLNFAKLLDVCVTDNLFNSLK